MVIVLKPGTSDATRDALIQRIKSEGLGVHVSIGAHRTVLGVIGDESVVRNLPFEIFDGVEQALPILKPYKLVSREFQQHNTLVNVAGTVFGGSAIPVIAGPCSIENQAMIVSLAQHVKAAGASMLRAGAYKPRTSPYSFQGLGEDALKHAAEARAVTGLPLVAEVLDVRDLELVCRYVDMLQIGARNVQNFGLLRAVGATRLPVLLKRGLSTTIEEFLMSAEYVASEGNQQIVLCERGIRTFETATRNTLDLSAVPILQRETHLPVMVDPSHGTGHAWLVPRMACAAVAAGADGLMIEVHHDPRNAWSDGAQSLLPADFTACLAHVARVAQALDRSLHTACVTH